MAKTADLRVKLLRSRMEVRDLRMVNIELRDRITELEANVMSLEIQLAEVLTDEIDRIRREDDMSMLRAERG